MNQIIFNVLKIINDNGYEAYLVGGYPRDQYLGISSDDYDICTSATSDELEIIFKDKIKKVGYGSMVLNYQEYIFQITTYRIEGDYSNFRHPNNIRHTNSLKVDLLRRDFIINTLCLDANGEYIDLLGARNDLDHKIIRVVGNTEQKIKEDSLRILRAIRFATILNFEIEDNLLEIIKKYSYLVEGLSFYRKKQELEKIFLGNNIAYGIKLINECNLFSYLNLSNLDKLVIVDDIDAIWAQLDVINIYPFEKNQRKRIKKIQELMAKDILNPETIYYYGLELSLIGAKIKKISLNRVMHIFEQLSIKKREDIHINLSEICSLYPQYSYKCAKNILDDIELKIINSKLANNRLKIIKYINDKYNNGK